MPKFVALTALIAVVEGIICWALNAPEIPSLFVAIVATSAFSAALATFPEDQE